MGLYTPPPLPLRPWRDFSMDIIIGLDKSVNSNNFILVVVDWSSKTAQFLPCKKPIDVAEIARLFLHLVRLQSIPQSIVSNRGVKLTSHCWKTIWTFLSCYLEMSTTFHLHTCGQTEVV